MSGRRLASFDLDQLLNPARAFLHPAQVVGDPDLTLNEKRAILAAWALDACAPSAPELGAGEAAPAPRADSHGAVGFEDIRDALRSLDADAGGERYRRALRRRRIFGRDAA
jgi:hypothetical protein